MWEIDILRLWTVLLRDFSVSEVSLKVDFFCHKNSVGKAVLLKNRLDW